MKKHETISIKEAAELVGVSKDTIRRWVDKGLVEGVRTGGKHRRVNKDSLTQYLLNKYKQRDKKLSLIYARVDKSSNEEDLKKQLDVLELYCASKGWVYKKMITISDSSDCGFNSVKKLLRLITNESISRLVLTNPDRLFLFGNEIIYELCKIHGIEVVIINEDKSSLYKKELKQFINTIDKQ